MKFLVINGHKYYPFSKGELNKTLFNKIIETISPGNEVVTTIIEEGYDKDEEINKFLNADIVIFQSPVNWFSYPGMFKSYLDEVYSYGSFFGPSEKYGRGGLLTNKKYMYSLTMNSPKNAFAETNGFYDLRSPDEMFLALHKLQEYCGLEKIETFYCYDVVKNPDIQRFLGNLEKHLEKYVLSLLN